MSTPNDTVFIYVLQRISDKAYLYIGSSINPAYRFKVHRRKNPYPTVREAFANNDIRFLVITATDHVHRLEVEQSFWRQFRDAGHPIVNVAPISMADNFGYPPWNKGKTKSPEQRRKISEALKGKPSWNKGRKLGPSPNKGRQNNISDETRQKWSEIRRNIHPGPETKEKMSKAHKGKKRGPMSAEQRAKISASKKGIPSLWNKGKPLSKQHRAKLSKASQGNQNWLGRHHSEEAKRKMSEAKKGKRTWNKEIPCSEETKRKISLTKSGKQKKDDNSDA